MPVIDDVETKPRPPKRTWRELPPTPPIGAPLPPPDPSGLVTAETQAVADDGLNTATMPVTTRRRQRRWVVPVAIVAALGLGGAALWWTRDDSGSTTSTVAAAEKGSPEAVAKALGPAVVQLEVGGGLGSGVIIDSSGLVLTAHHVVASSDEVTVKTADGASLKGRVVGRAPQKDLAVVAIDGASGLTAARLNEGTIQVGAPVVALGSPYGFQASVTSGIVSGLDRELDSPVGKLTGLIQTDTAINPGNSGGPLADAEARVIGINTAIASSSGGSDGVGFAVPVAEATSLIDTVQQAGGVSAPTVPAPDQGTGALGGLGGLIPGLDGLIPGLDGLIPGLDQLLPGLQDLLNGGTDGLSGLLDDLLNGILGDSGSTTPGNDSQGSSGDNSSKDSSSGSTGQPALAIIKVGSLPDGYTQGRSQMKTEEVGGSVQGTQVVVLDGPDGKIVVTAERSKDAAGTYDGLDGSAERVAGNPAKQLAAGALAFMPADDVIVIVTPEKGVASQDVSDVASAIEVAR